MTADADMKDAGQRPEDELARLQGEVAALRSQLDVRETRRRRVTTLRKVVAAVLVVVAAFGLTASVIGVWAARTTLDTERWVATVTPLDEDPAVRAAVSALLTDQIFATLNVEQRVEDALPPKAAFVAAPLTGRIRGYIHQSVNDVLASQRFRSLWPALNQKAHEQVMAIVNNDSSVAQRSGEKVTLDLLPVVNEVLRLLEQQIPTIFGNTVSLPTIQNGQVPAGLQARIESALGVQLPQNFATVTIYRGNQLAAAQDAVVLFKRSVALLVAGSLLILALALWISPGRRRTILQFGIWLVISVVAMTSLLRAIRRQLLEQVPEGVLRDGTGSAMTVIFRTLRDRGTQLIWLGVLVAAISYLVGPSRLAVGLRRGVAKWARAGTSMVRRGAAGLVSEGPGFASAHLDALRIGGVVVAAVLVLWVFSSWSALFVVAIVLGAYELLVTAAARSAAPEPTESAADIVLPSQSDAESPAPNPTVGVS